VAHSRHNIAILTGTRAEFGILTPVLHALAASKKLRPHLLVTGMHLQKQFGLTVRDIERSAIPIAARIPMYKANDTPADSLARATVGVAKGLRETKADLLLLLGDRLEMLAGANAALATQTRIAHLHGGETAPGTWDEQIRHAITKMAHLHFCSTKSAAARIAQMGESSRAVHPVGAPALDAINDFITNHSGFPIPHNPAEPLLLVLHPSSSDNALEERRARLTLDAISGRPHATIGPNNDPGHQGILDAYADAGLARAVAMSMRQEDFWRCLAHASVLLGNSSAGIIEAASFGLPVINLGDRQKGRERNTNVIDVPWSAGVSGIRRAIQRALTDTVFRKKVAQRKNLYGDGHASERIVKILESQQYPISTTKSFHDL
jgi:UDP-hydrolysing UDP-N-acetyl-D-glucosamine 2-epimerase